MSITGVELFAGGGGLLLGASMAGVRHLAAVEWDKWACKTLNLNVSHDYPLVRDLHVVEDDVRNVDWTTNLGVSKVDLVTGGPPCQPFSLGGKARSADDPRDMFPAMTGAIEKLRPRAFAIENVKGLMRSSFSEYFEFTKLRLQHPELKSRSEESWVDHYKRLQKEHTSVTADLQYKIITSVVDAADYGVPQRRHRVFIVGFRSDVDAGWSFPRATHSAAALRASQQSGEYWERHKVSVSDQRQIKHRSGDPHLLPWVTIRDALANLPAPSSILHRDWLDHEFQPGARAYPGHTGSPIDQPAKALKAGVHGVPGGENMIRYPNEHVRYFSVREAARIQTFPDRYELHGSWSEVMRQLGNAVPVKLAAAVVGSVVEHLELDSALHKAAAQNQRELVLELV